MTNRKAFKSKMFIIKYYNLPPGMIMRLVSKRVFGRKTKVDKNWD